MVPFKVCINQRMWSRCFMRGAWKPCSCWLRRDSARLGKLLPAWGRGTGQTMQERMQDSQVEWGEKQMKKGG